MVFFIYYHYLWQRYKQYKKYGKNYFVSLINTLCDSFFILVDYISPNSVGLLSYIWLQCPQKISGYLKFFPFKNFSYFRHNLYHCWKRKITCQPTVSFDLQPSKYARYHSNYLVFTKSASKIY